MASIHANDIDGRPWLTVNQAIWLMNIGRTRLYALIANNDIRTVKDGGKRLIDRQSVDNYRNQLAG
jgi:excisionase family DNA binding protein